MHQLEKKIIPFFLAIPRFGQGFRIIIYRYAAAKFVNQLSMKLPGKLSSNY
jgi:hypothetical protein